MPSRGAFPVRKTPIRSCVLRGQQDHKSGTRLFGRVDCLSKLWTMQRLARECEEPQSLTVCDQGRATRTP